MANTITVELEIDSSGAVKQVDKFKDKATKSSRRAGQNVESNIGSSFEGIGRTIAKVTSLAATLAAALTLKQSITSAIKQEEAVSSLNSSLALAGSFSKQASQNIQEFAAGLQRTTTVGDETSLALFGLARNLTTSNEQAKQLTRASLQLSAATGLSLESSVKNLGKTFGGLTGELGESLPAVRQFTQEQLKAGAAIGFVLDRFGGAAENKVKTFAGAIKQLSNAYGDSLEEQGFFITKSPVLIAIIGKLTEFFTKSATATKEFRDGFGDIFKPLANGLLLVGALLNRFLIQPFEIAFRIVTKLFGGAFDGASSFSDTIKGAFSKVGEVVKKALSKATVFAEIAFDFLADKSVEAASFISKSFATAIEFLKPFITRILSFLTGIFGETTLSLDSIIETVIQKLIIVAEKFKPILERLGVDVGSLSKDIRDSINNIIPEGGTIGEKFDNLLLKFDTFKDLAGEKLAEVQDLIAQSIRGELETPLGDAIANRLAELKSFVDQAKPITEQFGNNTSESLVAAQNSFGAFITNITDEFQGKFRDTIELTQAQIVEVNKTVSDFAAKTSSALKSGIANGAGQAFAAFGKALATGENALEAFANAFLKSIGQIAIQQGTAFILQGIGYQFVPGFQAIGAGLITAGATLATFGGVIAGISGGSTASSGGEGASQSSATTGLEGGAIATAEPEQEEKKTNQVVVQGDVFDSEETGLRIFEVISELSEKNGNVIIGGAFA